MEKKSESCRTSFFKVYQKSAFDIFVVIETRSEMKGNFEYGTVIDRLSSLVTIRTTE